MSFSLIANASICSDFVLATILVIIRRTLNLVQIAVPLILLISGMVKFIKLVLNPDNDKKGLKSFTNSVIAACIIFFLPLTINLTMNIINESGEVGISDDNDLTVLNLSSCWTAAENTQAEMDSVRESGGSYSSTISDEYTKVTIMNDTSNIPPSNNTSNNPTTSNTQNTEMGTKIVNYAKQFIGRPYVWGGNSLTNGTDCSGFIHLVYANFGIDVPRQSLAFRSVGTEVPSINEARAGDIICYAGHVALFEGDGQKIVHAKSSKTGIVEDATPFYGKKSVITIRRVLN